jgi:hypothetical protein
MRTFQFWLLLLGSCLVTLLLVKLVFVSHQLSQEQRTLGECQETVSQGAAYENAWKQLAVYIYKASSQDPAMGAILKNEGVGIHSNVSAPAGSTPGATPAMPSAPAKAPTPPPHPDAQ